MANYTISLQSSNEIEPVSQQTLSDEKRAVVPERKSAGATPSSPPPFRIASLWEPPQINPLNLKSYTLPIFNFANPYTRNFHLAWLGFFVAFLSWFAYPPLIPEAIKEDLQLTSAQVGNSNIVALCATLVVRLITGPIVDRFGPRLTMAGILVIGAIPSGLAGTVQSYQGLLVTRFFIGILGGSFVPCVGWTTCFFDTNVVGTANALAGGWGNMGGGVTYVVMTATLFKLHETMSLHKAWRVAFAVVPVPILLLVAIATVVFGTDHPAGKWSQRHLTPATAVSVLQGHDIQLDEAEKARVAQKKRDKEQDSIQVAEVDDENDVIDQHGDRIANTPAVATAVNEALTLKSAFRIFIDPLTWLPALAYMTTFGFELAVDSNLGNDILKAHPKMGLLHSGYYASIFGFLNLFTRPLGGIVADILYRRFGVKSKVYLTLGLGIGQGVLSIGFGRWLHTSGSPSIGGMVGWIVGLAIFNEMANGANFSLVPHISSRNNGAMSGLVGAFGNAGGIFFALIWRFHPKLGEAWWISGVIALGINGLLFFIPPPRE